MATEKLRRWYFTISRAGSEMIADQIRLAVTSARAHTDLEPVCIAEGLAPEMKSWLEARGVEIHYRGVPFLDRMANALRGKEGFDPVIGMGTYLRIFVPQYETRDDYVLYTDCDVIFQHHPVLPEVMPRFIAAGPETDMYNWAYFNAGVLVFNVKNFREVFTDFLLHIEIRMRNAIFCAYEQGDLNSFLWARWQHLPLGMNWKPYWGINDDAQILHFHGPKLIEYQRYSGGDKAGIDPALHHFVEYQENRVYYEHYLNKHRDILGV